MNLARASQRAATVPGRKSAARLYNDIEDELALGEPDDHLELQSRLPERTLRRLLGTIACVVAACYIQTAATPTRSTSTPVHVTAR